MKLTSSLVRSGPIASARDLSGSQRPRSRSISRRSFFVGRPAEGSRCGTAAIKLRAGGGGLWSMKQVAATGAPTRLSRTSSTSSIRSRSPTRAATVSPALTEVEGFAPAPFTLTWPDRHSAVDAARVGAARTAHNHLSTRVTSTRQASRALDRDAAANSRSIGGGRRRGRIRGGTLQVGLAHLTPAPSGRKGASQL
jgi:hypothetical protein